MSNGYGVCAACGFRVEGNDIGAMLVHIRACEHHPLKGVVELARKAEIDRDEALAKVRALTEKRPMETAPRDGTRVLLQDRSDGEWMVGYWEKFESEHRPAAWQLEIDHYSEDWNDRLDAEFTGWRPLPEAE